MATLRSNLELSLVDRVSGPAKRIDQNLENLRQQQRRNSEMFDQHRNAMLGSVAAAYVLARAISEPIQSSIAFSTQLEDIRQKADMSSEAIERLGRAARDTGLETAQGASNIAGAIDSMVGSGDVTPEQAQEISVPLGKASFAYQADTTEMANATSAMVAQLGISADAMEKAYDIMAVGGKQGKFELKDMAAQFPGVLANAKSLGIEGEKGLASIVAWLQISRKGTADGSSAATNLSEFMGKIMSQNSIKNFKGAGVDIVAEMARAIENNVDPIEHAIGVINGLTDGQRDKMGELFADKQVTDFLLQATKGVEEYRRIRDEALAADGTVERDFQARLATPGGAIARFEASIENLNIAIGNSLVPALADFARSVTPMIDGVASFVDANQNLVKAIVEITAALIGLRLLASAGGLAGAFFGLGGGKGGAAAAAAAAAGAGGKPKTGPSLGGWGLMGFNALGIGSDIMAFGDSMRDDMGKAWFAQRDANDAAANDWLANLDINGFKPFQAYQAAVDALHGPSDPAKTPQNADLLARINALEDEIATQRANSLAPDATEAALAPQIAELAGLRAELAALPGDASAAGASVGEGIARGISDQTPAVTGNMHYLMQNLQMVAGVGVEIPVRLSPNLSRTLAAPPGGYAPPAGPSGGQRPGGGGATVINNSFGPTIVQNPTNADARQIASLMGDQVGRRVRSAHTNGGMV